MFPRKPSKTVVAIVIYNRFQNLKRWIACWKQCETADAELVVIHNHYGDESEKEKYATYCRQHHITYIPRSGGGFDIGAFQDVCRNRLPEFPNYEFLLWCTDDCIPMQKDFIRPFLDKLSKERIGVACMQLSSEYALHIRTTGFCLRKEVAQMLTFPADPVLTKDHCYGFEHRAGQETFYNQILRMGLVAVPVASDEKSPLWDTEFWRRLPRQTEHDHVFIKYIDSIEKVQQRNPRFKQLQKKIRLAGTDNLPFFGNGYHFEGGLSLQQNPDEFAALCVLLEERKPHNTYVEIGSASGGACLFLHRRLSFKQILSLDDGNHPRSSEQTDNFKEIPGLHQYVGDSHHEAAADFLRAHLGEPKSPTFAGATVPPNGGIDVAFIDGDHSYQGVMEDILLVKPFSKPRTLIILHDIVAVPDVKRAWLKGEKRGLFKPIAEYVGKERPLGIGVAEMS